MKSSDRHTIQNLNILLVYIDNWENESLRKDGVIQKTRIPQMQKTQNLEGIGVSAKLFNSNIVAEIRLIVKQISSDSNTDRPQFLNQVIVDLVKSFIAENKPSKAIKVLKASEVINNYQCTQERPATFEMMGVLR